MIIVITGPTGVGKTKLSISLAKKYNAEVINLFFNSFLYSFSVIKSPKAYYITLFNIYQLKTASFKQFF